MNLADSRNVNSVARAERISRADEDRTGMGISTFATLQKGRRSNKNDFSRIGILIKGQSAEEPIRLGPDDLRFTRRRIELPDDRCRSRSHNQALLNIVRSEVGRGHGMTGHHRSIDCHRNDLADIASPIVMGNPKPAFRVRTDSIDVIDVGVKPTPIHSNVTVLFRFDTNQRIFPSSRDKKSARMPKNLMGVDISANPNDTGWLQVLSEDVDQFPLTTISIQNEQTLLIPGNTVIRPCTLDQQRERQVAMMIRSAKASKGGSCHQKRRDKTWGRHSGGVLAFGDVQKSTKTSALGEALFVIQTLFYLNHENH
jgi:hypothetical protein